MPKAASKKKKSTRVVSVATAIVQKSKKVAVNRQKKSKAVADKPVKSGLLAHLETQLELARNEQKKTPSVKKGLLQKVEKEIDTAKKIKPAVKVKLAKTPRLIRKRTRSPYHVKPRVSYPKATEEGRTGLAKIKSRNLKK